MMDIEDCLANLRTARSLRQICEEFGLPESDIATLSRIANGHHVAAHTVRRIGRKLGCVEPPRKLFRPVVSPEEWKEFLEWKRTRSQK